MSISIDTKSLTLISDWGGVDPDYEITDKALYFHLTRGFRATQGYHNKSAWRMGAEVKIAAFDGDSFKDWKFGFIQIAKLKKDVRHYVGRTRKDGSVVVNTKNLIPDEFFLDPDATDLRNPWNEEVNQSIKPPIAKCADGDHPSSISPLIWDNSKTQGKNLLSYAAYAVDFWTVLALQDSRGQFKYLAYFTWRVSWELKIIRWIRTKPAEWTFLGIAPEPDIKMNQGLPPEPIFNGLSLDGSEVRTLNYRLREANRRCELVNPPTEAVQENSDWFSGVPYNFYTP